MPNKQVPNLGYRSSLDGLRAIAVVLVMMAHANFRWGVNGGGLGVSVFFALSGFLITTLLLEEYTKWGTVSFKGFYIRRTMRLFPALYLLLLVVFLYAFFFRTPADQTLIYHDIVSAALYVYNIAWYWGWCLKEMLLYHTWSLGVEEQFYLIWPLILFICMKKNGIKQLQIGLLLFISISWMLRSVDLFPYLAGSIIKEPIFLGCAVALLRWNQTIIHIPHWLAAALLGIIVAVGVAPYHISQDQVAFNICGLLAALLILYVVFSPNSFIGGLLSNKLLVFIGKISYSLYLWHLPVFRVFAYHSTLPPLVSFGGKIIVSFVLAILSWYTVEKISTAYGRKISKKITEPLHA